MSICCFNEHFRFKLKWNDFNLNFLRSYFEKNRMWKIAFDPITGWHTFKFEIHFMKHTTVWMLFHIDFKIQDSIKTRVWAWFNYLNGMKNNSCLYFLVFFHPPSSKRWVPEDGPNERRGRLHDVLTRSLEGSGWDWYWMWSWVCEE